MSLEPYLDFVCMVPTQSVKFCYQVVLFSLVTTAILDERQLKFNDSFFLKFALAGFGRVGLTW